MTGDNKSRLEDAYFEWCQDQVRAEVASDFATLRSIPGLSARNAVSAFEAVPLEQREPLALAILRRWRQREVTDVERSWITAFDVHWVSKGLPADVRSRPLDLRLLRRTLKERASDLLGEKMPESGSSKVRYDLDVGDAVLLTFFEIGTSTKQLSYDQILRLKHLPGPPVQIVSSPLAWYGLWRETSWDALSPGDEEAAVDQLFGFCRRFMATIPDLLQRAGKSSAPDAGMA